MMLANPEVHLTYHSLAEHRKGKSLSCSFETARNSPDAHWPEAQWYCLNGYRVGLLVGFIPFSGG